jgi:hypothetical protein
MVALLERMLKEIFPDPGVHDCYLQVLCNGLTGQTLEKFILANGGGRNGKGVLNDLVLAMLGNFGYVANCSLFVDGMKSGANPEVANMNRKRMVVTREPPENRPIQFAVVKELTGGSEINARALYSGDTKTHIGAVFILECNKKPRLEGDTGYSMGERVVDVPFVSTYLPKEKIKTYMKNVHEANPMFKMKTWQEAHKHQLFYLLVDFMRGRDFCFSNLQKLKIDDLVQARSKEYVMSNDDLYPIFQEYYIEKDDGFVRVDDFRDLFTSSSMFQNLKKSEKREWSKKKVFLEKVKQNTFLHPYFVEKHRPYVDGKQILKRNVLLGWTRREDDSDVDEEDEVASTCDGGVDTEK